MTQPDPTPALPPLTDAERPLLNFNSYYLCLCPTGVYEVDLILSAVARAGKSYHSTEWWCEKDECEPEPPFEGASWNDRIQNAGAAAARLLLELRAENERLAEQNERRKQLTDEYRDGVVRLAARVEELTEANRAAAVLLPLPDIGQDETPVAFARRTLSEHEDELRGYRHREPNDDLYCPRLQHAHARLKKATGAAPAQEGGE